MTDHPANVLDTFWASFYEQLATLAMFGPHSFANSGASSDPDHHAWIAPLHTLGLLQVSGDDATQFLQGQLTADVAALQPGETTLAAHCDAKGRMHANFLLHCAGSQRYWLQMPASVLPLAQKALAKYAVFSRATVESISEDYFCIGFAPVHYMHELLVSESLAKLGAQLTWHDTLGSLVLPRDALGELFAWQRRSKIPWQGSARWHQAAIEACVGFVEAGSSGEFIPQMLNMDCLGGISFTKGCYTGQEIIARMKYRGSAKRRCLPFRAELSSFDIGHALRTTAIEQASSALVAGAEIIDAEGRNCGQVVNAVIDSLGSTTGLAVIKDGADKNSPALSVRELDTALKTTIPLKLGQAPYAIPKH